MRTYLAEHSKTIIGHVSNDFELDFSSEEEEIIEGLIADINNQRDIFHINSLHNNDNIDAKEGLYSPLPLENSAKTYCDAINCCRLSEVKNSDNQETPTLDINRPLRIPRKRSSSLETRSPLERFRSRARLGLTVTDLITPAWCEIKYWYILTRFGVQKKTPAMERGTRVHQKLESEVHTIVPIKIRIREDTLGLKIWNVIQGLRTLRVFGRTRELQVWGVVDGQLVGGKIDELSYKNPVVDNREQIEEPDSIEPKSISTKNLDNVASNPTSISYDSKPPLSFSNSKVYICDVKTRSTRGLPSKFSFRPTKYQLMLYHRFISDIINRKLDLEILTTRYRLNPLTTFSDSFIAQVCSIHEITQKDVESQDDPSTLTISDQVNGQDTIPLILANNNLSALWSFMLSEFEQTFPQGTDSIGSLLKAEYRSSNDGSIIGSKTFSMNDTDLSAYLEHGMKWWKGERAPEGVSLEEAYKCRSCEFVEICEWRLKKAEEYQNKSIFKDQEATNSTIQTEG